MSECEEPLVTSKQLIHKSVPSLSNQVLPKAVDTNPQRNILKSTAGCPWHDPRTPDAAFWLKELVSRGGIAVVEHANLLPRHYQESVAEHSERGPEAWQKRRGRAGHLYGLIDRICPTAIAQPWLRHPGGWDRWLSPEVRRWQRQLRRVWPTEDCVCHPLPVKRCEEWMPVVSQSLVRTQVQLSTKLSRPSFGIGWCLRATQQPFKILPTDCSWCRQSRCAVTSSSSLVTYSVCADRETEAGRENAYRDEWGLSDSGVPPSRTDCYHSSISKCIPYPILGTNHSVFQVHARVRGNSSDCLGATVSEVMVGVVPPPELLISSLNNTNCTIVLKCVSQTVIFFQMALRW